MFPHPLLKGITSGIPTTDSQSFPVLNRFNCILPPASAGWDSRVTRQPFHITLSQRVRKLRPGGRIWSNEPFSVAVDPIYVRDNLSKSEIKVVGLIGCKKFQKMVRRLLCL